MKMNMNDKYKVNFNGNEYNFDLMKIMPNKAIAVFDALSNVKMAKDAVKDLIKFLEEKGVDKSKFDTIVTAETKSVTMGAFLADYYNKDLVILRKRRRDFFKEVVEANVDTFTTTGRSTLYLDLTHNREYLENKNVLIFDDVLSTGSSLHAMMEIMNKVNAKVVAKAFIFSEGMDSREEDEYYPYTLPLIDVE